VRGRRPRVPVMDDSSLYALSLFLSLSLSLSLSNTNLCAWGEEDSGGHVHETLSRAPEPSDRSVVMLSPCAGAALW
jgi:hypothetical protein